MVERNVAHDALGGQQRTGQRINAADVGVQEVGRIYALPPQLSVEVEAAAPQSPGATISSIASDRSCALFGNWSVSQPFCGSPRFASTEPSRYYSPACSCSLLNHSFFAR